MEFDFIIVGAGSAGCILVDRLSEDPANRVLLLEAGSDNHSWKTRWPIGYGAAFTDPTLNWCYSSKPDNNGRVHYIPRGKIVGGSGAINAMVYTRSFDSDYADWAKVAGVDWGVSAMRSGFDAVESQLTISDQSEQFHPLADTFKAAATEIGYEIKDLKDPKTAGVGAYFFNIKDGKRQCSADVFLQRALKRPNVQLITQAEVTELLFDDNHASGVVFTKKEQPIKATATRAVVLAAGAINTPKLLLLAGIGNGSHLQKLDIPIRYDNANVGKHMQDHYAISYHFDARCRTLNNTLGTFWGRIGAGLQYLTTRKGPLALSTNQIGGFVGHEPQKPEFQLYLNPISFDRNEDKKKGSLYPTASPGFILCFGTTRPLSTGAVRLASNNPNDSPIIEPGFFTDPNDIKSFERGLPIIQEFARTKAIGNITKAYQHIDVLTASKEALIADMLERGGTVFHNCATARMAPKDKGGVVDSNLSVYGVKRLFVCDASIFPNITSGNTNAPTMAIAYLGARKILSRC